MNKKTILWRISPGITLTTGGKRGTCWLLYKVSIGPQGGESTESFGGYKTIKAAKEMIAHLKRKPIEVR